MDEKRAMLRHFLAALAYRTQKAVRGAPAEYADFKAPHLVRTPHELIRHMDSLMGFARTSFIGGTYRPPVFGSFNEAVEHFHGILQDLAQHLEKGTEFQGTSAEKMLQGPFSDAMTHVGQLAMLRRIAGSPVPPESFIDATITPENLTSNQAEPASPDKEWPERL
jgi:hypothetical protein